MKLMKMIIALAFGGMLAGCATVDTPSRNSAFDPSIGPNAAFGSAQPVSSEAMPSFRVEEINVLVPSALIVSEENVYYPRGDIVWRGDPYGDRHAQVKAIFDDALARGTAEMQGEVPVILDVTVERFHGLTEKTRYTVGGIHSIRFELAVRDAETGLLLEEPRSVKADLKGFGGQRAIDAEQQGQTQKVRVTDHLSEVIQDELRQPEGFQNPKLGLVQFLNNTF
ncbi:MAG: DUF6778 family protein [Roseobacter sp.]